MTADVVGGQESAPCNRPQHGGLQLPAGLDPSSSRAANVP